MSAATLTPGARAALELELQDAERDLKQLLDEHNGYMGQADVESALACDSPRNAARRNMAAASLRLRAFNMRPELAEARGRIERVKGKLAGGSAEPALSAEQVAAMDETAGVL